MKHEYNLNLDKSDLQIQITHGRGEKLVISIGYKHTPHLDIHHCIPGMWPQDPPDLPTTRYISLK